MPIVRAINVYHSRCIGLAWDIFWEYWNSFERYTDNQTRFCARRLYLYLYAFGMARNTGLNETSLSDFEEFFLKSKKEFKTLWDFDFEKIKGGDEKRWMGAYEKIRDNLPPKIIANDKMMTKILLATTKSTPAFDRNFNRWYSDEIGGRADNIFCKLIKLRERYEESWKNDFTQLRIRTRTGGDEQIPVSRLIDMAGWYLGAP